MRGTQKWMVKIMENAIKMDDLGVPLFSETFISPDTLYQDGTGRFISILAVFPIFRVHLLLVLGVHKFKMPFLFLFRC